MKRNLTDVEDEEEPKRSKLQLTFYASGIKFVRGLCSKEAFHAAKQLVFEQGVQLGAVVEGTPSPCVWIQGSVTLNASAAGFPHTGLHQTNAADVDQAAAAGQVISMQLCMHSSTGELLDAHSSCCPGGFQAVLGSFCPCIAALLLRAAQLMALPEQAALNPLAGLPTWSGSSVQDVLAAQPLLHRALCLVPQPSCYNTGLGLQPWQYEDRVSSSNPVHFASQRQAGGMYYASSSRPASDPDKLVSIEDAHDDLASDHWFTNSSLAGLAAPAGFLDELYSSLTSDADAGASSAASRAAGGAADGSAGAAAGEGPEQRQRRLLAAAVGKWLAVYGGKQVLGQESRPKVVNLAFELLLGGASGAPGRPLSSLALLLRGLWEYLHCHGLGRLLAKPLKAMHALRNILLVSAVPLWMRRAVAAQLDSWERSLLWQHAATPLEVTGAVGLVHLLRAVQEARQVCLHHWDEPQLAALLSGPVAEQQRLQQQQQQQHAQQAARPTSAVARFGSGSSYILAGVGTSAAAGGAVRRTSSSGGGPAAHAPLRLWQLELPSLLGLRLLMLETVDQTAAYLELAMAGGAWKKAIDCMLHSKERSQLLKAVQLLPRHIASLSERMGYMRKLLGVESLGAPERLELVARLLLDVREALAGEVVKLHIPPSRASITARYRPGGAKGSSVYPWHLWEATIYSLQEDSSQGDRRGGGRYGSAEQRRQASNSSLWTEWSEVMGLLIITAAQALFEVGRASVKTHKQHMQDISESPQPDSTDDAAAAAAAAPQPENAAGPSTAAANGGKVQREQHPPVMSAYVVDAMLHGPMEMLHRQLSLGLQAPVMLYCPDCQGMHPETEPRQAPPIATPQPGDASWQLLDVNPEVFRGCSSPSSAMGYPDEARGLLKARGKTGYIQDAAVLAAYRKVQPVQYPELLPLCSLDALCVATLSEASMAHFDAGGVLDTSLDLGPLRELLGHGLVEMGPAAVRVQAALEAAVYTSVMSPPDLPWQQRDSVYRSLAYQLLGAGQRSLALLAARTRFKLCPGPRSAGELLEVAIAAGPAAEGAAVDLVLGKGLVRPPDAQDEALLRGPGEGGRGGGDGGGGPDGRGGGGGGLPARMNAHMRCTATRLQRAIAGNFYNHGAEMYMPHVFVDEPEEDFCEGYPLYDPDQHLVNPAAALYDDELHEAGLRARQEMLRRRAEAREGLDSGSDDGGRWGDSGSESMSGASEDGEGGEGEQGRPIEIMDDDNDSAERQLQQDALAWERLDALQEHEAAGDQGAVAGPAAAAAAAAACGPVNAEALAARRLEALHRLRLQQQIDAEAAPNGGAGGLDAEMADEQQHEESLDTRQLLGETAAAAIQLKDTASSALHQPAAPAAPANPPAAPADNGIGARGVGDDGLARAAAAYAARAQLLLGLHPGEAGLSDDEGDLESDDEVEVEELMGGPYGRYGMQRPLRDLPPADIKARPKLAAGGSSSKPRPAAAAAGGGGGGGGGGDDDGPGSGDAGARAHKRSSACGGRRRRSASAELLADSQQAALVCELFGISPDSSSHPSRSLRIHLRRLSGLQLWTVARYAAGRGAAPDSVRRLGLAAWLSDNTTSSTAASMHCQARPAECLHWGPASVSQEGWLAAARRTLERTGCSLLTSLEPYDGVPVSQYCWSGLPSTNWASFVAQERLPQRWDGGPQHHSTPDANLAWLLAVMSSGSSSDGSSSSSGSSSRGVGTCLTADTATAPSTPKCTVTATKVEFPPGHAFLPSSTFLGAMPGLVFKRGSLGLGYYTDVPPPDATAAAAPSVPSQPLELDLSSCKELLQQLAALSKGNRYGLPMLQLCHALLTAGDRSTCLSLLPQALLPAGFGLQALTPNSCLVAALQELLPVAAKHGDVQLRVSAAVTSVLITRRQLPVSVLGDPDLLAGVLSWWCGLVSALHERPEEWRADAFTGLPTLLGSMSQQCIQASGSNNWQALQRLLVRCVLPGLGAHQASQHHLGVVPGGGLRGGAPLPAQQGYSMLLACAAVAKAPWPLQLYLSRLCWALQLASDLPALAQLLCPAVSSAVQLHAAGLADSAPADMAGWKAQRHARALTTQSSIRARDWVAAVLSWLASELSTADASSSRSSSGGSASSRCQLGQAALNQFVDSLCAALHGWHGPELLPLAVALQQLHSAQQQHTHQHKPQAAVSQPVLRLLRSGLLPAVGRADELAASSCVRGGSYKSALRSLMRDEALLQALPQDVARSLALTYWYQEATPAALLTANDMLLKLEGAGSAQALQLPQGTGLSSALAAAGTSAAAAAASMVCKQGVGAGGAALPQVHGLLLQHLDLVPSRGGLEAAGLRFMQLQVHASNGQFEAALESCFNAPPDSGNSQVSSAAAAGLSGQMEVADAVLRLVADNAATPSINDLMSSPPYQVLLGLAIPGACTLGGAGDGLLAGLSSAMQTHLLRLQVWRRARHIISRPPGISQRICLGPHFPTGRGYGSAVYNAGHMPPLPSWRDPEVVARWAGQPLPALLGYIVDQGLPEMQPGMTGNAVAAARVLCGAFEVQEQSLLWCVLRYSRLVNGPQLERDLSSLLSADQRSQLGQLPVFVTGLGQEMKALEQRARLMWAYASFKSTLILNSKVRRYILRNAHDQSSLQRYLVKFTVSELQALKAESLPWWEWDMGQKAHQAAELAEWLWWLAFTWPRTRSAAGASVMPL